jgi:glyceraldehyde-3-phosphate dehydrogenase (NADP+)
MIRFPSADEIPAEARLVEPARWNAQYLIDGEIRTWSGPTEDVRSPICLRDPRDDGTLTRAVVGKMPMLDADEAMRALAAARRAWDSGRGRWPTMRVAGRIECVEHFVDEMVRAREDVVRLLMWEIAKTRKDAETEFDRTVVYVRDTVSALKALDREGARFVSEEGFVGQIRRAPLGVVLCMGPFNYPLNETFTTLLPALIMGNTIVAKLPKYGTQLFAPLFPAFQKFPPGVINIIQGDGPTVIRPILESGDVDCLAFIGTARVANLLKRQHPRPNRMRSVTGLESKNPAVILPDADLDLTVKECVAGALSYNGQRCTALKLLFVHETLAEPFVKKLAAAVDALKGGMPWEPGVALTPLPEEGKTATLARFVEDAVSKGARVVNGGGDRAGRRPDEAVAGRGNEIGGAHEATYFQPAVVYPVTPEMELYNVEQFGPIVPVAVWREESEIDAFMRKSPYGQQVALFGRDPRRIGQLIDVLANQVCRINLNTQCRRGPDTFPFTGRKDSAEGTLSVTDALRVFSIRSLVATNLQKENKALVTEIVTGRMSSFLSTDYIL